MGEMAALCFGNGRPQMHIRGKVGLSIDYWKERRLLNAHGGGKNTEEEEERLWRVLIEVEETPNFGGIPMNHVTPVRSTNHWVSDEIKKHKYVPHPTLEWTMANNWRLIGKITSSAI